jgi:hypothetical protein
MVAIFACGQEPPEEKQKQLAKQRAKPEQKKQDTKATPEGQVAMKVWPFSFEGQIVGKVQQETVANKMITRNFVIIFDDSGSMADPDADGTPKIDTAKNRGMEQVSS